MSVITDPVVAAVVTNTNLAGSAIIGQVGVDQSTPGTTNNVALGIGVPGATGVTKAEDAASANADVGIGVMAIRQAIPANTSGADGDYEFIRMSGGLQWVRTRNDGFISGGTYGASADASVTPIAVTPAPATGKTIVLDSLMFSSLTALTVTIEVETSGNDLAIFIVAANAGVVNLLNLGLIADAIDKKIMVKTSGPGQIYCVGRSHSE